MNIFKNLGEYAEGYDREIHGPYDPARYYGKPDTPFGETRLIDLPAWLTRRSLNPFKWGAAVTRAYWRWQHQYIHPKRPGLAGIHQFVFCFCAFMYIFGYQKHQREIRRKYH